MGKKQDIHFGCVIEKQLMLFSLKFQRDNRQNALTVDPLRGKQEKKAVFSRYCGDETTTNHNRAFAFTIEITF